MDIDIREEWFGIANGLNLYINSKYIVYCEIKLGFLIDVKMCFSSISSEQMDEF